MRQEGAQTLEQAGASLSLATEYGFPYLRTIVTVRQGWALGSMGQVDEGIAHMRESLATVLATGSELLRPYHLALFAETCSHGGQIEAALMALEEALLAADQHTERFYEAELFRLKGELLLRQSAVVDAAPAAGAQGAAASPPTDAMACFQTALDIARRQGAKSLELRAALSLCRLWNQQGSGAAARPLLAEVYGWFTEGFDTADLQTASALLRELG